MKVSLTQLPQEAEKLANQLRGGDVLTLSGPLAAGKTTLTQAILQALGYTRRVNSPTFVLERLYQLDQPVHGITEVAHLDFYRLSAEELDSFDWREAMGDEDRLTIIEWPEAVEEHLPDQVKQVEISIVDEQTREWRLHGLTN